MGDCTLSATGGDQAADVLFAGDSTFDIEAGRAAGVRTAAVLWGPFSRQDLEGSGRVRFHMGCRLTGLTGSGVAVTSRGEIPFRRFVNAEVGKKPQTEVHLVRL